ITIAMSKDNEPYLVTLSHGYDPDTNAIYFHCAQEGKKIEFLKSNNLIWGQAVIDKGYVQGACDHLYLTIQFKGRVTFLENLDEKKKALVNMIKKLDKNPQKVISRQLKETSIKKVKIGRIDVEYMSGKKSKDVVISL
ncbi:MAG: pyridoxamine 5'-phosphate oxidase family protein, partial [Candidatus Hodarchaeales archaeon]